MNIHNHNSPARKGTTQAAEGLLRRRWSVDEVKAMVEAGVLDEDERIELIGGELVPMSPKGNQHELVKVALARYWYRNLPDAIELAQETTLYVNDIAFVEPDFVFYRKSTGLSDLKPASCLLVVEVADSSLRYDLDRKARLYATYGVRENWVIDAEKLITHVHRKADADGYSEIFEVAPANTLQLQFAPALNVALADLELV